MYRVCSSVLGGVCWVACAPACMHVSGAARLECLARGTRVHMYTGMSCGVGFEGMNASSCFTVQSSMPRCVSHSGDLGPGPLSLSISSPAHNFPASCTQTVT